MPNFIVIAFYTKATPYAEEIKGLAASCRAHGIQCNIKGYVNRGKWALNAGIKPDFILEMMDKYPDQNLVYLDADARVRKYPKLFDTMDADIAAYYRHGELLSGTLFIGQGARVLIKQWVTEQRLNPEEWDQKVLHRVLRRSTFKSVKLPATYCQIFDSMQDAGEPVIEHLQASRRFKHLVEHEPVQRMPKLIGGCRIRQHTMTGEYWIVRSNKTAIAFLDEYCIRVGRQLRWIPKFASNHQIDELRPQFEGKVCHIVGKGPSLDFLRTEHFTDGPIIALNEAIYAVEELELQNTYCLQQDEKLRATCLPKRSPIFVSTKAANYYRNVEDAYLFQNIAIGLKPHALSVSAAITIARMLGAKKFKLLCFDACINKNTSYAKRIKYASTRGGSPDRFHSHRAKILKRAHPLQIQWIIPEALAVEAAGRSRQ